MTQKALLRFKNVKKSFSSNVVLSGVDFSINAGEIVALVGENGAGKSTLMKLLAGVHQPDEGEILMNGRAMSLRDPAAARAAANIHLSFVQASLREAVGSSGRKGADGATEPAIGPARGRKRADNDNGA